MARVFMSHSKNDQKGRDFFDKLFGSVEHEAYWYSWEGPEPPHAKTLVEAIKKSASLFVVLSPPMDNPFTRTWVSYEVGVASGLGKNVWVFEPRVQPVMVPIPYVTGFVQYPERLKTKNTFPFLPLVAMAGEAIPVDQEPEILPLFKDVRCFSETCRASYYRWVYGTSYHCPVCLHSMKVKEAAE